VRAAPSPRVLLGSFLDGEPRSAAAESKFCTTKLSSGQTQWAARSAPGRTSSRRRRPVPSAPRLRPVAAQGEAAAAAGAACRMWGAGVRGGWPWPMGGQGRRDKRKGREGSDEYDLRGSLVFLLILLFL